MAPIIEIDNQFPGTSSDLVHERVGRTGLAEFIQAFRSPNPNGAVAIVLLLEIERSNQRPMRLGQVRCDEDMTQLLQQRRHRGSPQ
jgi:hypothetical protein